MVDRINKRKAAKNKTNSMFGKLVYCLTCKFMTKERVDSRELKR